MDFATLIMFLAQVQTIIETGGAMFERLSHAVEAAKNKGELTDDQRARIDAAIASTTARLDQNLAKARARMSVA